MRPQYLPEDYTRDIIEEWEANQRRGVYDMNEEPLENHVFLCNEYVRLPVKVFTKSEIETLEAQMRAEGKL